MKLPQLKNVNKWSYLAMSFLFPLLGMLTYMYLADCAPFGEYSMLYSDNYHQYYPFYKAFRAALLRGDSLLYSWDVGMGLDYLGLISYYLASPLNLLCVLVPEDWTLNAFSLLVPVKLAFAGLFFAIFLKRLFGRNDISLPLFGTFYAMCAWALGYQWNLMWLDTFALLPLVALGTVSLLRDKKFILYTITMFFSIFSNYYIGFFTCIFVLLLFICYQICHCKSLSRFCEDLGRIAIFTILAIGMTAILELPALAALGTTQSSVNKFPEGFALNIVSGDATKAAKEAWAIYKAASEAGTASFGLWWDAITASISPLWEGMKTIAGNMNGGLTPTFKEGLPNLYCGVGTIFFAFLFLTSPQIKLREKICSVCLLVFFMLSFLLRQLDYIWHGFHFTNMIPYRFSFLFSFVMLYMAYRAWLLRRKIQLWQIFASAAGSLLILYCSKTLDDPVYLTYNSVFFLLYFGGILLHQADAFPPKNATWEKMRSLVVNRNRRRQIASIALCAVLGIELIMNIVNFSTNFPRTHTGGYPKGKEDTVTALEYLESYEALRDNELFYRVETTHSQTLNDGALNGYHGISTFTSSANVRVTEFMRVMAYGAKNTYNRYCFEESSPVSNLFLNLKYMLERDGQVEENPYFTDVHHFGNVHILQNDYYLPLGFLADYSLADLEFTSNSAFVFQNALFSAATGLWDDVWTFTPGQWLKINPQGVTINNYSTNGYCSYKTSDNGGSLTYQYTMEESGFLCLDLNMNARNSFHVYKNGEFLYSESISLPQVLSVCQVEPGDVIEVKATCKKSESNSMTIRAALLNDDVFQEGYSILNTSTLKVTEFSTTSISGTIHCDRGGLLYTSIPQNGENWHAYVDGQEADIQLVGDAMIGLYLSEGEHEIQFIYRNDAFNTGWKVSLICLLVFIGLIILEYYPVWKNRKKAS